MIQKKINTTITGNGHIVVILKEPKKVGNCLFFTFEKLSNQSYFNGVCICGNDVKFEAEKVINNLIISCGCHTIEKAAVNAIYSTYRSNAKKRGYNFLLSKGQFKYLLKDTCHFCGQVPCNKKTIRGYAFFYSGIDRFDNSIEYKSSNVVSCCKICNRMKNDLHVESFYSKLKLILKRKNEKIKTFTFVNVEQHNNKPKDK